MVGESPWAHLPFLGTKIGRTIYANVELTVDKVNSRSDPYQLFLDSIRSPATLRRYKNLLHTFLKLIPNQLYIDTLGKTPKNRDAKTLAKFFVDLAKKDMDKAYYKNHQDCKILYCFVYDPEGRISNPTGLENDLKENSSGFRVLVKIIQN